MEKDGARWRIAEIWRSLERNGEVWKCGEVWSNVESGAKWRSPKEHGEVWSNVEKGYVFYFNYKLEFCPEASEFIYKTSEISVMDQIAKPLPEGSTCSEVLRYTPRCS